MTSATRPSIPRSMGGSLRSEPVLTVAADGEVLEKLDLFVEAQGGGEGRVVGGDDERARPVDERRLEDFERLDVEVVGRLVEEQAGRLAVGDEGQFGAGALAGGEGRGGSLDLLGGEAEGGQRGAGVGLVEAGRGAEAGGRRPLAADRRAVLAEGGDDRSGRDAPSARGQVQRSLQRREDRRLAGPVRPGEAEAVAVLDREVERAESPGRRDAARPPRG